MLKDPPLEEPPSSTQSLNTQVAARDDRILVVATSARMLAELAAGAGHDVVALDVFGDLDLQALCASTSLLRDLEPSGGIHDLVDAAASIEASAVVYGASFENHPELVDRLAVGRRLLGNRPATLRQVRDPMALGEALRASGLHYPQTHVAEDADGLPAVGEGWLRKPRGGGGGRGVRGWRGEPLAGGILQRRMLGRSCSIVAVADGARTVVLGLTEQLVGRRAFGATGYRWCGNLVPPRLGPSERAALLDQAAAICACVTGAFELLGCYGIDLVWDGARAWVVEVNPRPSASLEAVQAAHGESVLAAHVDAFAGRLPVVDLVQAWEQPRAAGKAILFATEDVVVGDTRPWCRDGIRDVPHPHERIARGHPICTVTAVADSPWTVMSELERRAAEIRRELRNGDAHAVV